ncbi:MAG: alpha/beta fold hydrolase [Pseudomonadota bacterium]
MSDQPRPRRRPWPLIALAVLILIAAIAYAGVLGYMASNQNALIFEPGEGGDPGTSGVFAAESQVTTPDGQVLTGWYRAPGGRNPIVLFFPGNSGALPDYADRINAYLDAGFGVLAIEYRGFGRSTGEPSLDGILEDARSAYRFALDRGIPPERIVLHGFSLGAMPATALAAEVESAAVVLEAPFTSVASAAAERYWFLIPSLVAPLIEGGAAPIDAIASVEEPVFVMHGTADNQTSIAAGEALYEAAPNKGEFLRVEGGTHQSLLDDGAYDAAIIFIRETAG